MRLDKFICKSTDLTRLKALECIHAGEVEVNGQAVTLETTQVHENNSIKLNGQLLKLRPFRYILLHKPAGTICSNSDGDYPSVFSGLNLELDADRATELHIAGRLDVDTTGLVLITDDGRWTYNITRPDKRCTKTYRVSLSYAIKDDAAEALVARFKQGIQLQGEERLTLPALLEVIPSAEGGSKQVLLTIMEGKYHQVKRMFAAVGNRVINLHREKIGNIRLDVEEGQWRVLTDAEVASLVDC